MRFHFTNRKKGNRRLILIFTGWSTDYRLFESPAPEGWDVAVAYDYRSRGADLSFLEPYTTIYLYAWSLGVAAANYYLKNITLKKAFAINGTLYPCSDSKGIAEAIYYGTAENLSDTNLFKFRKRVFGSTAEFNKRADNLPETDLDALKEELAFIATLPRERNIKWDVALVSENDRIFPADNQRNAWREEGVEVIEIPAGNHFPDFTKILKSTIVGIEQIRKRFKNSLHTYDTHASAQRKIATRLSSLFKEKIAGMNPQKFLEVGAGSGLLTNAYSQYIEPKEATFIDLYQCGPFGISDEELYVVGDAENWMENLDREEKFDAILSASVIQWFVNPQQFFRSCARHLSPDGVIAVSSFLPDNLKELDYGKDSVNFRKIKYLSIEELNSLFSELFEEVRIEYEPISITFSTRREMMAHLILTGVGGSGASLTTEPPLNLREDSTPVSLTYSPVYIIASHPRK